MPDSCLNNSLHKIYSLPRKKTCPIRETLTAANQAPLITGSNTQSSLNSPPN